MLNKQFIKKQFLKEWDFYLNTTSIDYNKTPIFYKIHLDLTQEEFEKYIKNFYELIINDNNFGYNILDKMFTFKEIEFFRIEFKDKIYLQKNYRSANLWINFFLQDKNFTINELLDFNKGENTQVFSKKFTKNYSELIIDDQILYFQHRNWGLDRMAKDKGNPHTQTEGWGKLKKQLEKLNPNILFIRDGSMINKSLGSIQDKQYY